MTRRLEGAEWREQHNEGVPVPEVMWKRITQMREWQP